MFTEELYFAAKNIWDSYYEHPFLKELGLDTLPKEKFKFYIIQDYLYLLEYSKLFALGVIKSKEESDMKRFAKLTDGILNSEMGIHRVYMKKLGITEAEIQASKPTIDNISYTSYMLSISHCGDLKEIAVAALSCMWSYKMISDKLKELYGDKQDFYGEWIQAYSSDSYDELTNWNLDIVEDCCSNLSEKEKERLKTIFINCSIFEYKFWNMSYKGDL
ncbi:MAG: thiaminase II [Cetobacterium sp.]